MSDAASVLLDNSTDSIGDDTEYAPLTSMWPSIAHGLVEVLRIKNGFYSFDSALLFRAIQHVGRPFGISEWNQPGLWKTLYDINLDGMLFFAEDLFGLQFCVSDNGFFRFDPETGGISAMGATFMEWISILISDVDYYTGLPLAIEWRLVNGELPPGERLIPKLPFVLGGKYEIRNLYLAEEVKAIQFRASIARQIRDLPDGSGVRLRLTTEGGGGIG